MKAYPIIHLTSPSPSFSWNDGLFAVIKKNKDKTLALCKINKQGEPQLLESGEPLTTIVGVNKPRN